jgi:hypothetical protein
MQSPLSQPQLSQGSDEQKVDREHSIIDWWVRITSPRLDSPRRSRNAWREEVASLIFIPIMFNVLLPIPAALNRPIQLAILGAVFLIDVGALFLKRAGFMTAAGLILMTTAELGIATSILNLGGHFDSVNLPLYDDLIQVSLLSMAFFPPLVAFGIVLINCCFLFVTLTILPHAPDLSHHLAASFVGVIVSPITLQIISTFLAYIIVAALIKAIRRADKAEQLAALESQVIEQQRKDIQLKEQLNFGITEILSTLNEAANGNFAARAPLKQDNALWRIGYSINNLLARVQGFRNEKAELEKTRRVAAQLTMMLRTGQRLDLENWTGTCLDPIIVEMMRRSSAPTPQVPPQRPSQTIPPIRPTRLNAP